MLGILTYIKAHISEDLESSENDVFKIGQIRNYIASCISIFKKALWIENNLSIAFVPNELTDDIESRRDLEEVYLLLKEKVVIRLNGRLNVSDEAGITIDQQYESIKKGSDIDLTFLGKSEYFIWGKQISLHTANLLTNICAKDVLQMQDGKTKILYDEEKGTPMYISYRGFLTEEDAREEMKKIIDAKEKYVNALTLDEYMK
ncbi:MAG: hypothetical protein LIO76_10455 [Clostridiales bacterium]|nr:hypothetical protein [Clostridiales bacterium]